MLWDYAQPVKIRFGSGRVQELRDLAAQMGLHNGLLVCTPHFAKNGLAGQLMRDSGGSLSNCFSELSPNPDVEEVDACAQAIRRHASEFVVALGGGSAMDLAKAAASISQTGDSIRKYHGTGVPMPQAHLPLIAVPTTAGTGSEVTCVAVLSDHKNGKKAPIVSDAFFPDWAVIDPELTYSMPPYVTACTGIDVLSHAVEGFWSKGHQPVCDACALHAAGLVFQYLPRAFAHAQDREAREKMCEASVIAGLAFTLPKTTASHACSFPLTNLLGIPHGEACGLTLDYFARVNADAQQGRVQAFARGLGFAGADAFADAILGLKKDLGLRTDLKDLHLSSAQVADLVRISRHPNLYNNPVEITDAMLERMYRSMC